MPARRPPLRRLGPVLVVVAGALAGVTACGDDGGDADRGGGSGEQSEAGDADLALGEDVYAEACASCHGSDLRGTDRGPSHLSVVYEPGHHPDEAFRAAIAEGSPAHHWDFGDMPPVPGLDDEQVDAVIAYIRDVQQREGFEPYPPE